ncbi:dCTP deaminase [Brachybacterium saurashtrense]|uniref:dCTP deaminase, dUMP-forming n=1 Tax=Brachybacterium saurashtrense TaxID=556288 RepID=A0A345YPX5_9MICO|nr:dCTP deaminase [Brachybacterium saurashtrense]RRR23716.1 dCTP deaminase [Brachybacterium saurashtrense]
MSAWEAEVLPLNYTRVRCSARGRPGDRRCRGNAEQHTPSRRCSANRGRRGRCGVPRAAPGARVSATACRGGRRPTSLGAVLLSDHDIRAEIESGRVRLEPFDEAMIQPASVDVRIDRFFRLFDNHKHAMIDPSVEQPDLTREVAVGPDEPYMLHPGEFVLASTYEQITLPEDVAARLEGKSSLGRLGLLTHSTAGFIDPGFRGHITLELSNMATLPVALWPGMKIGQLCFFRLSSAAENPYGSAGNLNRYLGQRGPTPSRSAQNFHRTRIPVEEEK